MSLDKRNWILAGTAIALLFLLAALLGALSGERRADVVLRRPSTYFTDTSGARALLLVMKKLLSGAEQWRQPLTRLPVPIKENFPSTLIVAGPLLPISSAEVENLDHWISNGGQLILASADGWPMRERKASQINHEENSEPRKPADPQDRRKASAKIPSYLSTHAPRLQWSEAKSAVREATGASVPASPLNLRLERHFSSTGDLNVVASASDNAALAVELPFGQGRIIAIADPMAISNGALRTADNAVWLVTLAAAWGNGRVIFDEYHHGFGAQRSAATLAWAFSQTPWGWCLWQIAAAGLLYLFLCQRRFGRISEPPEPDHSSPLEIIDARAGIFQAAAAKRLAANLIMQNLSHELSQSHGRIVEVATLNPQAEKNLAIENHIGRWAELQSLVAKVESGEALSEREFIAIGKLAGTLLQAQKSSAANS
jgi:hypothetical protein